LYNIPLTFRLTGSVDAGALRAAFADVLARHEPLHTVFAERLGDPVPVAVAGDHLADRLTVADVAAADLGAAVERRRSHRFDLAAEAPIRGWLLRTAADAVLLIVVHHIAFDGESVGPFLRDLSRAYRARLHTGEPPAWPPLPTHYGEYAAAQRATLGEPDDPGSPVARQLAFWRRELAGLPAEVVLPFDHPRPAWPSRDAGEVRAVLDPPTVAALRRTARSCGATLFMVLHAAVAMMLRDAGAGDDVVVGTMVAGRSDPELDDLVGFFVNNVVLRIDLSGRPSPREVLARAREAGMRAFEHADLPFEVLVDALRPEPAPGRNPLFQVALVLDATGGGELDLPGVRAEFLAQENDVAKFDLIIVATTLTGGGLSLGIAYASDLFEHGTAVAMGERLQAALRVFTADPAGLGDRTEQHT
jgi:pristinamycin I synthase-3/4